MLPVWWDDIKYFKPSEFDSPDAKGSGGEHMDEYLVKSLDMLRSLYGKPVIVTAGYRTATHNSKIGGAKNSQHLHGRAADIKVYNAVDRARLVELAMGIGFRGIGVYDRHIHLDTRDQPLTVLWSGTSK